MTVPPSAPSSPPRDPDHEPPVWSPPPPTTVYPPPPTPTPATPQYSAPPAAAQSAPPPPPPTVPVGQTGSMPAGMPPGAPPVPPAAPMPMPPSSGRNRTPLIIAIVAVLLLAGGGVAWFALRGNDTASPQPKPTGVHPSPRASSSASLASTQAAVARSATTFLNALGNSQPSKFCPLWDPANLRAELTAYHISSCQRLELTNADTKQLYSSITVGTPSAITVTGDKANIPASAFSPAKASDLAMTRGSDGTWRALFYNPANGPSTPTPQPSVPYTSSNGVPPPSTAETSDQLGTRFLAATHASCPTLDGFFTDATFCRELRPIFAANTGLPKIALYGTGGTISFNTRRYGIVDLAILLGTNNKWTVQYFESDSTIYATESLPTAQWGTAMQAIVSAYRSNDCRMYAEYYYWVHTDHPTRAFCNSLPQSKTGAALRADPSLTPAFLGGNSSYGFFSVTWTDGTHHTMMFVQVNPTVRQADTRYVLLTIAPAP